MSFLSINKTLWLNNFNTRTAMNPNFSVFVIICAEAIMYLLLYNLHDCTFNVALFGTLATNVTIIILLRKLIGVSILLRLICNQLFPNHVNTCFSTVGKVSVFGVILVHIFPHSDWIQRDTPNLSVLSPNVGIYGPK